MVREAAHHPRISIDPAVMFGKPCVKGTRIPVYLILRYLGAGQSADDVTAAFPSITADDIAAALRFAADIVDDEPVVLGSVERQPALTDA
jgi:uncharacterized protein (DUF433 family)